MRLLGATTLIVTNAAGGLNSVYEVGDFMMIEDHLSFAGLAGLNALIGKNLEQFGRMYRSVAGANST
jgi:purine-nucleoside phosphorylase